VQPIPSDCRGTENYHAAAGGRAASSLDWQDLPTLMWRSPLSDLRRSAQGSSGCFGRSAMPPGWPLTT